MIKRIVVCLSLCSLTAHASSVRAPRTSTPPRQIATQPTDTEIAEQLKRHERHLHQERQYVKFANQQLGRSFPGGVQLQFPKENQ